MPDEREPVVVDTGPLVALNACQQIDLLRAFHSPVMIPTAVANELRRHTGDFFPDWVSVRPLRQPPSPILHAYLDEGEAAAIALAIEAEVPLVLIDERRGRMVARMMGLTVSGSLGVLLRAKKDGLLVAVRPCVEAMRANGIWLGELLVASVLAEADEAP